VVPRDGNREGEHGFCYIVGGVLSPLLANILLDDLDRELEQRGHRFVRYADDCNIYVRTQRAGERVLTSVRHWIETRLKLRVNRGPEQFEDARIPDSPRDSGHEHIQVVMPLLDILWPTVLGSR